MKSLAMIPLALVAFLAFVACDELPDQSSTEASAPVAALGAAATAPEEGWSLTVTKVSKRATITGSGGRTTTALGVYLVVDLTLENTSKTQQALCGNRFKLADDQGRNYTFYEDGTNRLGKKELCAKISPGLAGPAVLVFDVPADATGVVLRGVGGIRVALGDITA
ncbi:MAG: DUF4352 domain-containing protein, partial [Dehalococcoidia bacterium]